MSYNSVISVNSSTFDMTSFGNDYYNIYFFDASSNNIVVTLPTSYYDGLTYEFVRTEATLLKTVTLNASGSGITINGGSSALLRGLTRMKLVFLNNNWIATSTGFVY